MAKTLASQAKDGGSIPLARSVLEGFETAYDQAISDLGRFNLAIFGKTGVGKSTLINAMFGAEVAATGTGRPVTLKTQYYEHPSGIFGVYDSEGIEVGQEGDEILARFHELIADKRKRPIEEQIHVIWYCVRAGDLRFEDSQAAFIEALAEDGLPIVFVLTQVQQRDGEIHPSVLELARSVTERRLPLAPDNRVFFTMALPDTWGGWEAFGLQELLDATFRVAPEGVANALTAAQKIDLARKAARARVYVKGAALSAAATGATPIPFSDAALLVPIQVGLMAKIAADLRPGREEGDARHAGRRGLRRRRRDDRGPLHRHQPPEVRARRQHRRGDDPRRRRQRADVRRRRGLDRGLHAALQARAGSRRSDCRPRSCASSSCASSRTARLFHAVPQEKRDLPPALLAGAGGGTPVLHPRQLALELAPGGDALRVEARPDGAAGLGLVRAVAEAALRGELVDVGEALARCRPRARRRGSRACRSGTRRPGA